MRQIDFLPLFLPFCRLGNATHPHILWFWEPFPLVYRQKLPQGFQSCMDTRWECLCSSSLHLMMQREDKDVEKMFARNNCSCNCNNWTDGIKRQGPRGGLEERRKAGCSLDRGREGSRVEKKRRLKEEWNVNSQSHWQTTLSMFQEVYGACEAFLISVLGVFRCVQRCLSESSRASIFVSQTKN